MKALGSFAGKYTSAAAGYVAAVAARSVSDAEWARFAAAGIFGDALAAVFGTQDPVMGPSAVSGRNSSTSSAYQSLAPVTLGNSVLLGGR